MKKNIVVLFAAGLFGFSSCQKFLTQESESQLTPDVIFSSVDLANNALTGVYSLLTTDYSYSQRLAIAYPCNSDIEWIGADNSSYNANTYRGLANYLGSASNDAVQREWDNAYKLIERANRVISGIEKSPVMVTGSSSQQTAMKVVLGQAIALRALTYFDLVRNWGDVPYKTENTLSDLSNVYLGATDRDVIMDSLIVDLQKASIMVPWVGQGIGSAEAISKGYIKGLTARVALTRAGYSIRNKSGYPTEKGSEPAGDSYYYYKIARQECLDVMNSGIHRLNPSFRNVWQKVNSWVLDRDYNENLFEVALGYQRSGEMGYSVGVRFYENGKYGYGNNANMAQTGAYYYYMFDRNDLRKDATIAFYQYSNSSKELKEFFKPNPLDWNFAKWDLRLMSASFLADNINSKGKVGYGVNWIMMRYSDVLLMFAEAENEINNSPTQAAKDALKLVRTRAFSSADQDVKVQQYVDNLAGHDAFFNAIVDERAFEFGGEGVRKYDLVRWNLLGTKIQAQRDALKKMLNREAPYDMLPTNIYYNYAYTLSKDANGKEIKVYTDVIDRNDINMYEDRSPNFNATEYTRVQWLNGASQTNKDQYSSRADLFSSGLDVPVKNRHLFPIGNNAINESNGQLKNSYGF